MGILREIDPCVVVCVPHSHESERSVVWPASVAVERTKGTDGSRGDAGDATPFVDEHTIIISVSILITLFRIKGFFCVRDILKSVFFFPFPFFFFFQGRRTPFWTMVASSLGCSGVNRKGCQRSLTVFP